MPHRIVFLLGLLAAQMALSGTVTYTVGGDGTCDYSTIQQALDAGPTTPGAVTEIQIARNAAYDEIALKISGSSAVLRGGYDNCSDDTPSGRTVLNGAGGTADSVITVFGSSTAVTLVNLSITGGDPLAGNFGGGIQITGARVLELVNSTVNNNSSQRGGGVYFDGAGAGFLIVDGDSAIFSNTATQQGGGIYCKGVFTTAHGDISFNSAITGAGVYADQCDTSHFATTVGDGIFFNQATGSGGGAFLTNDSTLRLQGTASVLSGLFINSAMDGGGVYINDVNSEFSATGASIQDNSASGRGGAIFMAAGEVTLDRPDFCTLPRCSVLSENLANGEGGAVYMLDGTLQIRRTYAFDNSSPDGSLIKTEGGSTFFEGMVAYGNSNATSVMRLKNGSNSIRHSTLAHNSDQNNTLLLTGGTLLLRGSILWEPTSDVLGFFGAATTQVYDCLLASAFPVTQPDIILDAPQFVDAAGGDFHILATSPAVDFCFNLSGPPGELGEPDIDGDLRGQDIITAPDGLGRFDLGADEVTDKVFADGFEIPFC